MSTSIKPFKQSFKPRTIQYQPANAYWLSVCADEAYESAKKIKAKALNEWGFEVFNFIKRADTQCFIASTNQFIVIAFRGTEVNKYKDLLTDADLALTTGYGGKVHKGFKQAYAKVRSVVKEKLKAHNAENKTLWLTGHSLGGALAVLAAYELKQQGYKVNGVYTIGQPRVGNNSFSNSFDKLLKNKCFRFIDKDDKVPEIPLKEFGYSHVGQSIYIASKNRLVLKYKRSKNVFNGVVSAGKSLSAHSSDKYVKALEKNIDYNPVTSDVQVIKEKAVVNLNKEVDKASKSIKKETKKVAKKINNEGKKAVKTSKNIAKKIKGLF